MFSKIFCRLIVAAVLISAFSLIMNPPVALADAQSDVEKYTAQIKANPNDAEAYKNRGDAYAKLKKYDKALDDCNKAIEFNPNSAEAYNNRGIAYSDLNNYKKAVSDYTKAIELKSNDGLYYYNRGLAYEALGDSSRADPDFKKATELGFKG